MPRYEYLIGKLAGVLLLLVLSVLAMSALFLAVLFVREQMLVNETLRETAGLRPEQVQEHSAASRPPLSMPTLPGIVIIYLKAALLAALTLFISPSLPPTSSPSWWWFSFIHRPPAGDGARILAPGTRRRLARQSFPRLVALAFPDLQLFNLVDDIVAGTAIPMALFAQTAVLGCVYTSIYLFFAWVAFHGREL